MEELKNKFDKILIHPDSINSELAQRARDIFPAEKIELFEPSSLTAGEMSAQEFTQSKRRLLLKKYEGKFFKRCPGAKPGLSCCNYFVLNWGQQCDMNCSYCYLQSMLNYPAMILYTNLDEALQELKTMYAELGQQVVRIGTGEVVDSLSLDQFTGFSKKCVEVFHSLPKWTLELKTKSACVENLLQVKAAKNVIVSWSINPQNIIEMEEHGTAALNERLAAAEACQQHGYTISFHIDPMIWHPNWQDSYNQLIAAVSKKFKASSIPYLSVGALRFQPEQRHIMRERFSKSLIHSAEVFVSSDGKLRYDSQIRQQMYDFAVQGFKKHDPAWNVFLCMETPETWLKTMKDAPQKMENIKDLFDNKVIHQHARWARSQENNLSQS